MDENPDNDPQVSIFVPALFVLLKDAEKKKGKALTRREVLSIRDKGVCVMMPMSRAKELEKNRGYKDIIPAKCWEEWQSYQQTVRSNK